MKNEQSQLFIILLVVFIGFIGTSMPYPIFPPLFLHSNQETIMPVGWNSDARNILLGIALAAYPMGQFFGLPILGSYSDHYGRKKILIVSLIGSLFGYALSAISLQKHWLLPLLLSRFLTGLMEGNIAIARAMAADLIGVSKYKSFGKINAAASIGYLIGPLLGGFLSDKQLFHGFSFATPFFIATIFTLIAIVLVFLKLKESDKKVIEQPLSLLRQFNLIKRFHLLFRNPTLKYLLITSSVFTFAIDIFYEFGPVYLTSTWLMTPAWLALYNVALCATLAIGHGWLSHYFSIHFSNKKIIIAAIITTAIIFYLIITWPSKAWVFLLFALSGFSIAIGTNNITVQISNNAANTIQGEVMGSQLGLRMLGDAIICFAGGFIITASVAAPLIISSVIALIAVLIYIKKLPRKD